MTLFRFFGLLVGLALLSPVQGNEIKEIKGNIKELKEDISYLELSAEALDTLKERLEQEYRGQEQTLTDRLSAVLIPLLNWPRFVVSERYMSWVEHQSVELVLESVQAKLIQEPLALLSGREVRLVEVSHMQQELQSTLESLEQKQGLLELQIEELRLLEDRDRTRVQRAEKNN